MQSEILKPVAVLVAWTLVVLIILVVRRLPAMKAVGIDLNTARGGRPGQLDGVLPDSAQWPAHNYIHLVEQPTLFYAIALLLAVVGLGAGLNAQLAWAYVGLRVLHSLIQITANIIRFRFLVFFASTAVLMWMTVNALIALF